MTSILRSFWRSFLTQKWEAKCLVGIFRITVWRRWNLARRLSFVRFWTRWIEKWPHFTWKWGHFLTFRVTKCDEKSSGDNLSPGSWRTFWHLKCCLFCICCYKKGGILDAMGLKGHIEFVCRMRTTKGGLIFV